MSEPLNRKQVEMLAICICSQGGEGYRSISGPSLQDWLDTDAALRAELEARVTDVLNADKLVDSLTAENERLRTKCDEMSDTITADTSRFVSATKTLKAICPEATSLENGIELLRAQVTALEQQLSTGHQFAIADHEKIVRSLEQDKADSQTANAALRDELEQLRIDYRSEQHMSEDLDQQLEEAATKHLVNLDKLAAMTKKDSVNWEELAKDALARHALLQQEVMVLRIENDDLKAMTKECDTYLATSCRLEGQLATCEQRVKALEKDLSIAYQQRNEAEADKGDYVLQLRDLEERLHRATDFKEDL